VDLEFDQNNCGTCGHSCGARPGVRCDEGQCACASFLKELCQGSSGFDCCDESQGEHCCDGICCTGQQTCQNGICIGPITMM